MDKYKAVGFDWGNVLNDYTKHTEAMARHLRLPVAEFERVVGKHVKEFHLGLSEMEFWNRVCPDAGIEPPQEEIWRKFFDQTVVINDDLFDKVRQLKELGYKTAMISNAEPPNVDYINERIRGTSYDLFDVYVFSSDPQVKEVKPNPRIYLYACDSLEITPEQLVFIDDSKLNVEGAQANGIRSIHHTDNQKTIQELSDVLGVRL